MVAMIFPSTTEFLKVARVNYESQKGRETENRDRRKADRQSGIERCHEKALLLHAAAKRNLLSFQNRNRRLIVPVKGRRIQRGGEKTVKSQALPLEEKEGG